MPAKKTIRDEVFRMKVTALDDELINEISNTSLYLIRAINFYRRRPEHRFTHTQIGRNMQKAQGTVSKMLSESNISSRENIYGNLSITEAKKICSAMNTTLGNVLFEYEQHIAQNSPTYDKNPPQEHLAVDSFQSIPVQHHNTLSQRSVSYTIGLFSENDTLTNNAGDPMFIPWFGKYHCYFFSTLSTEQECFEGELEIPKSTEGDCCQVRFSFVYDKKGNLRKEYYGQLVLSKKQNGGAFCTLINHDDQGEITYLVMANPTVNNSRICCIVAFVATISAGKDTKHPCVERMIISREPLDGKEFEIAKTHLLFNDKYIRITEDGFCKLLKSAELPASFKDRFAAFGNPFDAPFLKEYLPKMAIIPESWVKSLTGYSEYEHQMIIDLMRLYSEAPKYNKIRQKTSENDIYMLFKQKFESSFRTSMVSDPSE